MALYPENNQMQAPDARNNVRHASADGRRRSSTASYYSTGNSKMKRSPAGDNDDASYSINTVNAIAAESDFQNADALEVVEEAGDRDADHS